MENICYSIFNTKNINCRCSKPIFSNNLCKYHCQRKKIIYFKEINKKILIMKILIMKIIKIMKIMKIMKIK